MKKGHLLIIIALVLFYAINNYLWLLQNKSPIIHDEGIHLWTNLRFVRAIIHPAHNIFYELYHANTTHWPPLLHFTASLLNLIFGNFYIVSVMTNMLFFLLLIVSLYFIGRKIRNASAGILAAIVVSFYPIIYGHSRLFLLDLPLTSIVTFSIYSLISIDKFRSLRWSIIFGIAVGLGMLTKWSYALFILPLWLCTVLVYLFKDKKNDFLYITRNFFICLAISFFIVFFFYIVNIENTRLLLSFLPVFITRTRIFAIRGAAIELLWIFNNMMLFFPFLLFIISLIIFYAKTDLSFKLFITIWFLAPIALITFMYIHWVPPRFFMPVLPSFALISGIGLDSIRKPRIKNIILGFILTTGMVAYFNISFTRKMDTDTGLSNSRAKDIGVVYKPYLGGACSVVDAGPPRTTDWKHRDIARSFASHIMKFKGYPFMLGVIYEENDIGLNNIFANRVMNYYLIKELIRSDISLLGEVALALNKDDEAMRFIEFISDMQGMVYISRRNTWPTLDELENFFRDRLQVGPKLIGNPTNDRRLIELINSRARFALIDRIKLPHDYYANLYLYKLPEIEKDGLLIKMFNGKIKIFYKNKEITKAIGITFTSVYNNEPYSYKDAMWDFYSISPYQLKVVSEWPALEVRQTTLISIDLNKKDTVNISSSLECQKDIKLDYWYMDSLVSDEYRGWLRPFSQGAFKEIPIFSDPYIYEPIDERYTGPNIVGIRTQKNGYLPASVFMSSDTDVPIRANLYNACYYHNARCVRVITDANIELKKGKPEKVLDIDIVLISDSELESLMQKEALLYEK